MSYFFHVWVNKMNKRYIVFIQDEWNNLYWIGEFRNLKDSIPDINSWLSTYNVSIDSLEEYPCTFGPAFDKEVITEDETVIMVRGFILEGD